MSTYHMRDSALKHYRSPVETVAMVNEILFSLFLLVVVVLVTI